ncbi:MAG: DMT family transporter [Burkholderiales bacterium]|nr:MAG: DMT family transporter [Burkholderiales bacterium]
MSPSRPVRDRMSGYGLLLAGMALVGLYVALVKPLTAAMPVFLLAWLRFGIGALAMLPWLRASPADSPITPDIGRALFLQSLFGNFLFSVFMLYGVSMTSAGAAGVILATLPAMVALFSWLFLRERLTPRVAIAIALAVAGVAVLSVGGGQPGAGPSATGAASWLGNLLVFACVGCEAVYVILGKRLTAHLSARRISALINLWGLALTTPFGLWQARDFDFAAMSAGLWALLMFYALSASMASTWLWLNGLQRVPANHSGVFTIALPLSASAVAVAFLGERLTVAHAVAFACAAAGILLVAWPRRRRGVAQQSGTRA